MEEDNKLIHQFVASPHHSIAGDKINIISDTYHAGLSSVTGANWKLFRFLVNNLFIRGLHDAL